MSTIDDALKVNGEFFQLNKLVEECSEVTKEVMKYHVDAGSLKLIGKELVDLYLTADIIKTHLVNKDPEYKTFFESEYQRKIGVIQSYLDGKK